MTQERSKYSKEEVDRLAADLLEQMAGNMIYGYEVDTSNTNEVIVAAYAIGKRENYEAARMITYLDG